MRRSWLAGLLGVIAAIAVAGVVVGRSWTPAVPGDDQLPFLTHATVAPGPRTGNESMTKPVPVASACVDTMERPSGTMRVCWGVLRITADADPVQDYYVLKVTGSLTAAPDVGSRWASLRARFVGRPAGNAFTAWPNNVYDGSCGVQPVDVELLQLETETLCGRTTGSASGAWGQRVTWTCVGCLIAGDRDDREVVLYEQVAVAQGAYPSWDIYGDFGG